MASQENDLNTATPGPWRVAGENCPECWQVENSEGDFIAQCEDRRGFASLDAVANARLIAAAPDLLTALESAEDALAEHCPGLTYLLDAVITPAIAKARGYAA